VVQAFWQKAVLPAISPSVSRSPKKFRYRHHLLNRATSFLHHPKSSPWLRCSRWKGFSPIPAVSGHRIGGSASELKDFLPGEQFFYGAAGAAAAFGCLPGGLVMVKVES